MNITTQPTATAAPVHAETNTPARPLSPSLTSSPTPSPASSPTSPLNRKSLDQLETDIIGLSQHINASEYEFLVLLREFDLRQGWKAYHFNNCAEWLNMKCGMAPRTARDKLKVANALYDLPTISGAFQKGDLSYSKARSLCRVATPQTESELLGFALKSTAGHVERHCIGLRNAMRGLSTRDARRLHRQRHLTVSPNLDGSVTLMVELSKEQADLVIKALELAGARNADSDRAFLSDGCSEKELSEMDDNGSREPSELQQQQADALVELARTYLVGGTGDTNMESGGSRRSCTADHYQVTVHVDERALRGEPDEHSKSDLPIETVRRLCCDGSIVPLVRDETGKPARLGRKHRVVNSQLRRALLARDRGCRFPGCTNAKWLDAHHVVHWADGGETAPDNLVMLCSAHHRLLHEGGFEIKPGPGGEWQFRSAGVA
jgi:hypothetical protein